MRQDESDVRTKIEQRLINEEYNSWKKNTPHLYNLIFSHPLEWPSLTVEWLSDYEEPAGKDYSVQKLILGTHTSDDEPNYLMIAEAQLPVQDSDDNASDYDDDDRLGFGRMGYTNDKVQIVQQIVHDGEVNRARYMPQNPFIIATKTISGEVYIFDYQKHPPKPPVGGACSPDLRLRGHKAEGFGLSWSKFKQGHLLSSSDDAQICLWDINGTPRNKGLDAMQIFKINDGFAEDVSWHLTSKDMFGSCGNDKYLHIWDVRTVTKPKLSTVAHQSEVNCLAFNPNNEYLLATGSTDKTVKLFDLRKFNSAVHTFEFHTDEVCQVGWNPQNEMILSSSCAGRRVLVWDRKRINQEQTTEDTADGPPELLFVHGGHTNKVTDFSWNPCDEWLVASVGDDNTLQIWQMNESIYREEDDLSLEEA